MTTLADDLVPDALWTLVAPLLPIPPRPPYGGRHRAIPDRACFAAIVYMARASTSWRLLPARELGCGTSDLLAAADRMGHRRVFDQLHLLVLDRLSEQGGLDWSRASVDSMSVRAKRGGDHVGANPVDRGKPGSKLHLVCDAGGLPLTVVATAANLNDTTMFQAVMDDLPAVRTLAGRRRSRPGAVHADKGYDSRANRAYLRHRGIRPRLARRGIESSTRLGRYRWRVTRSLSWLSCFRRLQVRWDRDAGRWFAFVLVACAVVCFNRL